MIAVVSVCYQMKPAEVEGLTPSEIERMFEYVTWVRKKENEALNNG